MLSYITINNTLEINLNLTLIIPSSFTKLETTFLKPKTSKTFLVKPDIYNLQIDSINENIKSKSNLTLQAPGIYELDYDFTGQTIVIGPSSKKYFLIKIFKVNYTKYL